MSPTPDTFVVTGASGQLGRLALTELRRLAPDARLVGLVRDPARAEDLTKLGIEVRQADYDAPDTLAAALAGADRVLLVSSSEVGRRADQHRNVIAAAKAAGVRLLAYTSLLHADRSPLALAEEHRATEDALRASGLPVVVLRNGWYTENYTGGAAAAVQHGVVLGAARSGRISAAARADYATAAATVLAGDIGAYAGQTLELAGDHAFTLAEYAAELARQSGKPVAYSDLPEADYRAALEGFGLPAPAAAIYAESDAKAADDALFDEGGTLGRLIGRPTTPLASSVAAALAT